MFQIICLPPKNKIGWFLNSLRFIWSLVAILLDVSPSDFWSFRFKLDVCFLGYSKTKNLTSSLRLFPLFSKMLSIWFLSLFQMDLQWIFRSISHAYTMEKYQLGQFEWYVQYHLVCTYWRKFHKYRSLQWRKVLILIELLPKFQ